MSLYEWCASGFGIAFAIMSLVQISPIKIDPWTWLGNAFFKGLYQRMDKLDDKIDKVSLRVDQNTESMEERHAEDLRTKILRFSDEIFVRQIHSQEHFNQALDDINKYEQYCRTHPDFINNKAVVSIQRIMDVYKKCLAENSFN